MLQDSPTEGLQKPVQPPEPTNGAHSPQRGRNAPRARVLQVTVTLSQQLGWRDPQGLGRTIGQQLDGAKLKVQMVVALADAQGLPVASVPSQEFELPLVDTVEFKTPGEALAALIDRAESQMVEAWEAQQNAG